MSPLATAELTVLILLLFWGVYVTVLGLPGTVIIFGASLLYALLSGFETIGIKTIVILAIIVIVAEGIGFMIEMLKKPSFGFSLQGLLASLIGSLIGTFLLMPLLLGFGVLLGIFLGGFTGLFLLEIARRSQLHPPLRAGWNVILLTTAGIFAKGFLAIVMTVFTLTTIYS